MRPRKIYIDCTATHHLGINTGIQRVVRNIVKRAGDVTKQLEIECIPVVSDAGRFWKSPRFSQLTPSSGTFSSVLHTGAAFSAKLQSHEKAVIEKSKAFKFLIVYAYGISAVRRLVRYGGYALLRAPFLFAVATGKIRLATPSKDDILLMPDSFWAYDIISPLKRLQRRGVKIIPVIHDLIPITHAQYCANDFAKAFSSLLPQLARVSSGFITISQATQAELLEFFTKNRMEREKQLPMGVFYSGGDMVNEPGSQTSALPIRDEIARSHNEQTTFLMVGTIEPRKGHDTAFEAMSALWDQGFRGNLVIVGRIGWMCESLLARLKASPYYKSRLHVYNDANDHELHYLYQKASALIFASHVEGFGLPLVEAMQTGLPVIASDIPVFREIAADYPVYFQPGDTRTLKSAIQRVSRSTDRGATRKHQGQGWITWDEATAQLIQETLRVAETEPEVSNDVPLSLAKRQIAKHT